MYLTVKALHIIAFTAWFAGLFYVVRLFIYNTEARLKDTPDQSILIEQLCLMQRRLWRGITWPAMVATIVFGGWLVSLYGFGPGWVHVKLSLVLGLVGYHLFCGSIHHAILENRSKWTSNQLRALNEVATLFLVAIVFVAVYKNAMTLDLGIKVVCVFAFLLILGFSLYKVVREKKNDNS